MLASTAAGEVALGTGVTKYPVTGFWGIWGSTLENFLLGSLDACRLLAFSRGGYNVQTSSCKPNIVCPPLAQHSLDFALIGNQSLMGTKVLDEAE